MSHRRSGLHYLLYFILFNFCFFCWQVGLVYSDANSFISLIAFPWSIYAELFITICFQFFLYLLLAVAQTFLLLGILKRPWHYFSDQTWQMAIWTLSVLAILSANAYYFPLSIISKLLSPFLTQPVITVMLVFSLIGLSLFAVNGLLNSKSLFFIILVAPLVLIIMHQPMPTKSFHHQAEPNIIILGIDSLSPESVTPKSMPFLSHVLKNTTQFTQAISPLARTYPAWSSILTGLYVQHHHAEENLIPKSAIKSGDSIAWTLSSHGYSTVFATDDRRFNSIDKEFGFQKIIGPKLGVNDVILGSYNDFPLGNLLINFRISAWPFPYNYSNRASFFSYYPQTFNAILEHELRDEPRNKPLFLAVHFTLPHWPYAWAESLPDVVNNEFSLEKRGLLYQSALQKVDQQFSAFYSFLRKEHYLDNSLVIILSDHGEALYYPNSRLTNNKNYQGKPPSQLALYLKAKTATVLNKSAGHGSDILSPKQYHSIVAFTLFKNGKNISQPNLIKTRIALIDLAPTILSFLKLPISPSLDGISLWQSILNTKVRLPERTFYIESGMYPNQLISKEKAMVIGKTLYGINTSNGELELSTIGLKIIEQQKLYGIIKGDWILALYPNESKYIAVIQNLKTGEWSDDLNSVFARSSPASELKQALQYFYGSKIYLPIS